MRHAEGEAKIRIDTLEVINSNLGRRRRARRGETPNPIEPPPEDAKPE